MFSECGGVYVTPFHILTTANCAILLKQKMLTPIRIQKTFPSHDNPRSIRREEQHFNISEIYLHPSRLSPKTTKDLSQDEEGSSKNIALLQINYLKEEKSYLKKIKAIQIQSTSTNKRVRPKMRRGGTMISFGIQTRSLSEIVNGVITRIQCKSKLNRLSIVSRFECDNKVDQPNATNESNILNFSYGNKKALEGFPLVSLESRARRRQNVAIVGWKTSEVSFFN